MGQNKDLIAAIARLSRMIRRHPVEKDSLGRMSFHVLRAVPENEGIRATELAELVNVRPASMTEALKRLERDGYVIREKDAADSRAKRVFITEKARAQLEERMLGQQAENNRLLSCLTDEEADMFLTVCGKLCAFLEQESADVPRKEKHCHKHDNKHSHHQLKEEKYE